MDTIQQEVKIIIGEITHSEERKYKEWDERLMGILLKLDSLTLDPRGRKRRRAIIQLVQNLQADLDKEQL